MLYNAITYSFLAFLIFWLPLILIYPAIVAHIDKIIDWVKRSFK